jgi:hypothetical protein
LFDNFWSVANTEPTPICVKIVSHT